MPALWLELYRFQLVLYSTHHGIILHQISLWEIQLCLHVFHVQLIVSVLILKSLLLPGRDLNLVIMLRRRAINQYCFTCFAPRSNGRLAIYGTRRRLLQTWERGIVLHGFIFRSFSGRVVKLVGFAVDYQTIFVIYLLILSWRCLGNLLHLGYKWLNNSI